MRTLTLALAAATMGGGVLTPLPSDAQRPPAGVAATPAPGWLGIDLVIEIYTSGLRVADATDTHLVIRSVAAGSPAAQAGLHPGDRLTHIDGDDLTLQSFQEKIAALRAGDMVALRVLRNGAQRTFRMEVAPRPAAMTGTSLVQGISVALQGDSAIHNFQTRIDSLRSVTARIQAETFNMTFRRIGPDSQAVVLRYQGGADRYSGPSALTMDGNRITIFPTPDSVRALRPGVLSVPALPDEPRRFTFLSTGRRVVAGAELAPLNPQLARYFRTNHGVLVVEVLEGTPAARGRLQPGDVVVEVGSERVETVEEFRAHLDRGYRSPPVPVTVVRDGERLVLRFPR